MSRFPLSALLLTALLLGCQPRLEDTGGTRAGAARAQWNIDEDTGFVDEPSDTGEAGAAGIDSGNDASNFPVVDRSPAPGGLR